MGFLKTASTPPIEGAASAQATARYAALQGRAFDAGHYSDFRAGLKLSAIGIGTFPGAATDAVDRSLADIVRKAVTGGINVIDTAVHYRYGRSMTAVGAGLRRAFADGVPREAVWVIAKGGFVRFEGAVADPAVFVREQVIEKGLARADECAGAHVLSPAYLRAQLDESRVALGLHTLDAFLVDQPEVQIGPYGKETVLRRLGAVFAMLEQAVAEGVLRHYGLSTFEAFRVATDDPHFLSLASLVALAEKAAKGVFGSERNHHFAIVELPFNAVMLDGFTRFNQVTGDGRDDSTLQAALKLGIYTVASHGLFKGHLARNPLDILVQAMPRLANDAQRALQFNRSTPGLGTTLVGMSTPGHLDDVLAVARAPMLTHAAYMALYRRTEN
ncbi:MAG: aldo/keto reductase [Gammaproteobacteria bacterium]|nr:aldo/keto reductase [Gammaproteobacteria bacterium]